MAHPAWNSRRALRKLARPAWNSRNSAPQRVRAAHWSGNSHNRLPCTAPRCHSNRPIGHTRANRRPVSSPASGNRWLWRDTPTASRRRIPDGAMLAQKIGRCPATYEESVSGGADQSSAIFEMCVLAFSQRQPNCDAIPSARFADRGVECRLQEHTARHQTDFRRLCIRDGTLHKPDAPAKGNLAPSLARQACVIRQTLPKRGEKPLGDLAIHGWARPVEVTAGHCYVTAH